MKIAALITGGGYAWLDFLKRPGGSKILDSVIIPYSRSSWSVFGIDDANAKVDLRTTLYLLEQLQNKHESAALDYLVINAALTTDRPRSGENRAYISLMRFGADRPETIEVNFPKLKIFDGSTAVYKRINEDEYIGRLTERLCNSQLVHNYGFEVNVYGETTWRLVK